MNRIKDSSDIVGDVIASATGGIASSSRGLLVAIGSFLLVELKIALVVDSFGVFAYSLVGLAFSSMFGKPMGCRAASCF